MRHLLQYAILVDMGLEPPFVLENTPRINYSDKVKHWYTNPTD